MILHVIYIFKLLQNYDYATVNSRILAQLTNKSPPRIIVQYVELVQIVAPPSNKNSWSTVLTEFVRIGYKTFNRSVYRYIIICTYVLIYECLYV